MTAAVAFAKALGVGLLIAAPVGPIGLLTINRTLDQGRMAGLVTGLGAALGSEVIATGVPSLDVAHTLVELGVGVAQVMVTEPWAPKRPLKRGDSVVVDR